MLTRRSMMLASIAAGVTMNSKTASAKAAQPSTPVNFEIPAGACDCHTHIHGDPAKFPFFAGRVYTPELASPEEMSELHKALKIERVVIVTPSVYGPDNSSTLYGMMARGASARGVAVIDDKTPESDLETMQKQGFAASASIWQPAASTIRRSAGRASRRPSSASKRAAGMCSSSPALR
jgi:predicted TIM-barrel fold metal-dependent hydrolase